MANRERWARFEDLPADLRERLERLPTFLEKRGVLLAYLFGSLATQEGKSTPGDVDLALLVGEESVRDLRADLQTELATRRLDLVDLARASPLLRFHVIRDGRLLYARDDDTLNQFEQATLHLYRDPALLRRRHERMLQDRMDAWAQE